MDTEIYGNDICNGEVRIDDASSEAADDLRACLSFVSRDCSESEIAKMLIASGPLDPLKALDHAATVKRAMDEIRQLLRDKATPSIMRRGGLGGAVRSAN